MTSGGKDKIKSKFQDLVSTIKEEAVTESKELRDNIIEKVDDIKDKAQEKYQDKVQDNVAEMVKDLEAKALKLQYTVQEKYSEGADKKDEYVLKTADALVEAINKAKKALTKD
ncbi:MAG: hypothetical protein ACYDEQ_06620 [Desulfocucumaceae bacterium]